MTGKTVFWSWQSDTPKRETREVIHHALEAATVALVSELAEAERVEVDQGTRKVPGMAGIAETILKKIDEASAFVADITAIAVIGEGRDTKWIPNPNVMLELGYARKSLGEGRLIPVFNAAFGPPRHEELPFDLRHQSGSIKFELPEGAETEVLRKVRASLQRRFTERLREMITEEPNSVMQKPEWYPALPSDPSIWEEGYNPLAVNRLRDGRIDLIVEGAPRLYVRLLPLQAGSGLEELDGLFPGQGNFLVPLFSGSGLNGGSTANGGVNYEVSSEERSSRSVVRWFRETGELWAISNWGFYQPDEQGRPQLGYDEVIKDIAEWLPQALRCSGIAGSSGPYSVKLGAVGLSGVRWWQARPNIGGHPYVGLRDCLEVEGRLESGERGEVVDLIMKFMNSITQTFGVGRLERNSIETLMGVT